MKTYNRLEKLVISLLPDYMVKCQSSSDETACIKAREWVVSAIDASEKHNTDRWVRHCLKKAYRLMENQEIFLSMRCKSRDTDPYLCLVNVQQVLESSRFWRSTATAYHNSSACIRRGTLLFSDPQRGNLWECFP